MPDTNGQPVDGNGIAVERRRPGRREVSPTLIPLLRRPAGDGVLQESDLARHLDCVLALRPGQDPLASARGVAMSLLLSLPLWGVVGVLSLALHR